MRPLAATVVLSAITLLSAPTALANDDEAGEFWLNPSVTRSLDNRTSIEMETAQRFRSAPRDDTYFIRGWVNRDDAAGRTWSFGVEQRWNGPDEEEQRLLQQVSYALGPIDMRTRFEQRWVSSDPDVGLRVRQRLGGSIPMSEGDDAWSLTGDAEVFVTLRPTEPDGQTGVTRLRTFLGFERSLGRFDLSLGYLREHDIRENGPDRIGHAPFIGFNVNF
jgi:hypothetical protein